MDEEQLANLYPEMYGEEEDPHELTIIDNVAVEANEHVAHIH